MNDPTQSGHYSVPGQIDTTFCGLKIVRLITENEVTCPTCKRYFEQN